MEQHNHVLMGAELPEPDVRPYVRITGVPLGGRSRWALLHASVFGALTHFWEGQTLPCPGKVRKCTPCLLGAARRWEGFIGVQSERTNAQFILRIPASAMRHCPRLIELSQTRACRGAVIDAYRMGASPHSRSPVRIDVLEKRLDRTLLEGFPLDLAMARWWGLQNLNHLVGEQALPSTPEFAVEGEVPCG